MKIIADCGATKSQWRAIHSDGSTSQLMTGGINASTMPAKAITEIISDTARQISATDSSAAEIYLYIAGLTSEQLESEIQQTLSKHISVSTIDIQTDLMAAARAVCGRSPGIAAIIGTGSNSCQYDGRQIVRQVYSGGFILGDEGSAATLGRIFLSDFIKGLVPKNIASDFSSRYPSDYDAIVRKTYRSENSPSGYLGSFAPFIMEHYDNPYIRGIVDDNIRSFFRRCIKQYDTDMYPVGIVGSFGYVLKDIVARIAAEEGVRISRFIKAPIDGLIEYHSQTGVL